MRLITIASGLLLESCFSGICPKLLLCLLVSSSFPAESAGWKIKFDGNDSNPVIADGVLYVGSADGAVYALDPTTGATKWRFQTEGGASSARGMGTRGFDLTPSVRKGTVFAGSGATSFYALDAMTGERKWSYAAGSKIVGSAVYDDGPVYVVTGEGLHALDASTGQRKWLFETLQEIPPEQMNDVQRLGKRPALGPARGEKALFLTAWPNRLTTTPQTCLVYAVAPESGTTNWVIALDGSDITAPVTAKGLVFITAEDPSSPPQPGYPFGVSANRETLYAINEADGQIKWKLVADRLYGPSRLLVIGDRIYFQTDKRLIAAEVETGRTLWSFGAENIQGDPKVDDRYVYVVTHKGTFAKPDDTLHALAVATGQESWSQRLSGGAYLRMVHEGVVYAGQENLYALDAAAGKQLWSFKKVGRGYSARLISGGRMFVISPTVEYFGTSRVNQGYLYALDAKTGKP